MTPAAVDDALDALEPRVARLVAAADVADFVDQLGLAVGPATAICRAADAEEAVARAAVALFLPGQTPAKVQAALCMWSALNEVRT